MSAEIPVADLARGETLIVLDQLLSTAWFYYLDLIGTVAFAVSGAIKSYKLDYDYFGTVLLVALRAVGGGTVRDIVVGGDRHPPFIFNDPVYLYIVFGVVVGAIVWSRFYQPDHRVNKPLNTVLNVCDTVGVAAFTVIGAKVAIISGLDWFWAPILAALTCSGGSVISNAVTGHESSVLKGEFYEEVAAAGGLFLVLALMLAQNAEDPATLCVVAVVACLVGTFGGRWWVIQRGIQSPTLQSGSGGRAT